MTDVNYMYWATALTGGGDGALDSFDGADLTDKDGCVTIIKATGLAYFHVLDATSGLAEASPDVVAPDDNAGTKRWILVDTYGAGSSTFLGLTDSPASYVGQAGKYTKVNAGETALEFTGDISGTNTGDQDSIVGITGTTAEFNTALTDADFATGGGTATGTNTGDQTITLTGNVTGSGTGSFATTIADKAVALAKMDDLAQDRVIGRISAGAGVPEALTGDNIRTMTGLATTDSPVFANTKLSGLGDGKIPYHVDDATGFADGPTRTDVDDAVSKKHTRSHSITSTSDHTSTATAGQILKADANGLPVDATNTDADVSDAVSKKHTRSHLITSTSDHTSTATSGQMLKADANGLPVDATNTDADVSDAVSKKHSQGTDTALGVLGTKNPPINADKFIYRDSTNSDALVTSTGTEVKAYLKTYFDGLYNNYTLEAHKDTHDPEDGGDPLDTAAPSELASVQVSGVGTSHSFARADHQHQIQHGITDNHLVTIDSESVANGEYAKFTANGLESKSVAEVLLDIGVESGADVTDATNVAAAGAVMDADFTAADEVMVGTGAGTHNQVTLGASQFLGKKAAGAVTNLTAADARTILNVEDGADVTDATNVDTAGAVMEADYNAHTVLYATDDNTPTTLTVTEQTVVGRLSGGNISAVSIGVSDNNIVQVDDADVANADYVKFTADGLEGRSYSEVMGDLSGQATADFDINTHQITSLSAPDAAGEAIRQTATITETSLTQLTDGSDTALHDHDGITENTAARHTQNTDTGTTQTSFVIDSGGQAFNAGTTTSGVWSKTIGSGGDYADFAACIAATPDLLAHAVTITIKAGTTLTETCYIRNKHATVSGADLTVQAEKYWPTTSTIPTATAADGTTLTDNAGTNNLKDAGKADDYFNGCWIFIVDGTGTDNGFVPITDYDGTNGIVSVASWTGTQPDNTSRYLIVGVLIDASSSIYGMVVSNNTCRVNLYGIGIDGADYQGLRVEYNTSSYLQYCGIYNSDLDAVYSQAGNYGSIRYCGVVANNTDNNASSGGIRLISMLREGVWDCGISDNNGYGIISADSTFCSTWNNFGDDNGTYGTYARDAGIAKNVGTECSGSSGNHGNGAGDGSLAY